MAKSFLRSHQQEFSNNFKRRRRVCLEVILPVLPIVCEAKVPTKRLGNATLSDTVTIATTLTHITKFQLHPKTCDGSELLLYLSEDNLT